MELVEFIAGEGVILPPFATVIAPRDTKLWLPDDNVTAIPG